MFEVDQGWKVEGVDGYFDDDGRPIQGPVATERIVEAGEDDDEVGLIPGLDPRVQYGKMKEAIGLGPNEQFAREAYTDGDRLFRETKYHAAAKKFEEAVDRGPHAQMEQDAMFMLAESYFFGDRYIKARDAYDALVKEHPNTRYMDTLIAREWEIAQFWEKYEDYNPDWTLTPNGYDKTRPWFDTIGHAVKTYDNIRLNDPTGPRADDAIMATANIYFRRGRYDDADYHYTLLRTQYPRSELQFEAHLLGLQAKLRKYQGADYDGSPLEEAKQLVKQLRMQFAGRLSPEEKERLRVVEGQLNLEVATRDYRMAEYNDGTKHYGAARYYYAAGDPEVSEHRAGHAGPRSDGRDFHRARAAAEAFGVVRRPVPGEQRAVPRGTDSGVEGRPDAARRGSPSARCGSRARHRHSACDSARHDNRQVVHGRRRPPTRKTDCKLQNAN